MKTYSVKDIASVLGTNPETVRIWIRNGKLPTEKINSKKEGWVISQENFNTFLFNSPKYIKRALMIMTATTAVALGEEEVADAIVSNLAEKIIEDKRLKQEEEMEKRIPESALVQFLAEKIVKLKESKREKVKMVVNLQNEIKDIDKNIAELSSVVNKILESDQMDPALIEDSEGGDKGSDI